ncbi:GTP pyrophosphokinase family protein [Streptococcus macacae]|uniref:RelA/SpoT domain protein n=1 Tax=Streptococcus macacae NCTC 11558 TaxID=764298 RepID=G5JU29_9STRE|nr:GTP pyrophosphokinase family protein [Streptococcus macacae]EHJ51843.1 RelA/SpoT domain protein [Streptococcus macacae NCTC 11558]SUN78394.1 putative GTP-pyrophosphokinase [Streptococcus macacae NCTC 11558]
MVQETIYGKYETYLPQILENLSQKIQKENQRVKANTGFKLFEHFLARVKTNDSMIEKCQRKQLPLTAESALKDIRDAIGIRIICGFVDDIYKTVDLLKKMDGISISNEKDYIYNAKPNGYRSYHLILEIETPFEDCLGQSPGKYFAEVQLRTIAMDSWASLEHQMKYKHDIKNPERIAKELKRCADELASCDLSMQTIRNLIAESGD